MSTYYVPSSPIPFAKIKEFHYEGIKVSEIEDEMVWLTDGRNYLCVVLNPELEGIDLEGGVPTISESCQHKGVMFSRFGANDPELIIEVIEEFFDVELVSEYEESFYEIVAGRNESSKDADEVDRCEICRAEKRPGSHPNS